MLHNLDFEKHMTEMTDRNLLEFTARQVWEMCQRCEAHEKRIAEIENGQKTMAGLAGGTTGGIVSALLLGVYFFLKTIGIIKT